MTVLDQAQQTRPRSAVIQQRTPHPALLSIGLATPDERWPQPELTDRLARLWRLNATETKRWRRIVAGSGVEMRHGVAHLEHIFDQTTAQRMRIFEQHAPLLAHRAAEQALAASGIAAHGVTDLIVVSCTGFSAPGVDVELVERLGLRRDVRRNSIGFMGCFGAMTGLRTAVGACAADPNAIALVVCVELCSVHFRPDRDPQNQVACALFGDGAAAAVVAAEHSVSEEVRGGAMGRLTVGGSLLIPEGRDWMTWRITDAGFAMTLTRDVPPALQNSIRPAVESIQQDRRVGGAESDRLCYAVHPGGPGILRAVDAGLDLGGRCGLEIAWSIMRRFGNMSSPTVLFVLAEMLREGYEPPVTMLAFGPGLTVESVELVGE